MPIVDGLTSTKMIRSFEKSHPTHILSTRASLNGRVPIIAVSASLLERDREKYLDAGFDGWILKPIAFNRLSEIITGIVDKDVRRANLYRPGRWENGGWFEHVQRDVFAAKTTPMGEAPSSAPSKGVKMAAAVDDPAVKEEDGSRQTQEQQRLLQQQAERRKEQPEEDRKATTLPELGSREYRKEPPDVSKTSVTDEHPVTSPGPIPDEERR